MDVILVISVRARAQHRGKARAGACSQILANVLRHVRVGELDHCAAGKPDGADVERVGLAMLGQLCSRDPVTAAAIVRGIIVDALERAIERASGRHQVLAHPLHDRLGKSAANDRGRHYRDPVLVWQHHRFEPHQIIRAAFAGPSIAGMDGASASSSVNRRRHSESAESAGSADCKEGALMVGRGRGNGTVCAPARSQAAIRRTNMAMSFAGMSVRLPFRRDRGVATSYSTPGGASAMLPHRMRTDGADACRIARTRIASTCRGSSGRTLHG